MNDDEYRIQLLAKLNALVAVLEVAIEKIEKSMDSDETQFENARLEKILANLRNTKAICLRAKQTLRKGLKQPTNLEYPFSAVPSGAREYTEMSSVDEYRKFQSLPPIEMDDVKDVDLMDLCDKLQAD